MEEPVRVLLIEDSPLFVVLTQRMLAKAKTEFAVETADNLAAGIERLAQGGIDAVLLDLTLPDSNGLDTFIRLHQAAESVPTIIYTSVDDESLSLTALNQGAADYLVKSEVNDNWLARSLIYAIQRSRSASAVAGATAAEEQVAKNALAIGPSPDDDAIWVARIQGKRLVTINVLEELKSGLLGLLGKSNCREILLDMTEVEYLGNAAISMLLIVHKRSEAKGKRLVFRHLKLQVREQFSSRRFDRLFNLEP